MNSINKTARLAGLLYLALAILGPFGLLYVPSVIGVAGDPAATAANIVAYESLLRAGVVSNLLAFTVNIFTVVVLHKLFAPVNRVASWLMVILISVGVALAMLNELNQVAALLLLVNPDYVAVFTGVQLQGFASFFLELHEYGVLIAHIFFGLWLVPMGYLVIKSGFVPKVIGYFLYLAALGYLVDFVLHFLFPAIPWRLSEFTFLGEVMITLWLLIKGVNVEAWRQRWLEAEARERVQAI